MLRCQSVSRAVEDKAVGQLKNGSQAVATLHMRRTDMNKLGVHALVWEAGWSHDECARAIARTAEVGYDFIEAPALDPSLIDPDFTRRQLEKNGLGISFSLGLDESTDLASGDREKARRGKERLEQAIAVCRDCGGNYI